MANPKAPPSAKSSAASQEANEATAPTIRKQYGRVVVSTWPKTVSAGDGKQRETTVSSVTRNYRDGDERKRTAYLFPEDLLHAGIGLILRWVELQNAERSKESSNAE